MNRSPIITILLGFSLLFAVYTNINIVNAQQGIPNTVLQPRKPPTATQQALPSPSSPSTPPTSSLNTKLHTVKIISPTKGQQVPVGKDLSVSGISTGATGAAGNAVTSHCQVSVIVNNIKPYQPVTGTGPGGAADYSKWNFVLTSKYATIKPGPNNKITAKYACSGTPSIVSFYSANVTGVVVPFQQNKPVVSNNVTNTGNATGIIHPSGGSKHTSPIATGGSNSDGATRSDGKTSNGSNPISKGIPSGNNKINEMKNRITQNLEKHLRKSG
ncbi:MAG: hypothetical protein WBZ20_02930 [Nitrososphaeraceae archaeon]